ncbi:HypC/HybG/HupF family hydrogenase formation chaperone [Pectinatus frisingensis]|jgi:hydrogenase expression/formation protein HypC|uniref:HypC/HybG/HupF family hydrogenase formation chaperone n=1 Tax=Pectinatus frisingensis TaxID=865 RepID=UPI0018C79F03|nr:HypC/HybG/HupF family hydrogenase formation chaperone [Pectinatus frisingensis]
MCLAVPAKIMKKDNAMATVEVEGIRRKISLMLLPEANQGDFVLMHAGFAIQIIDEAEAELTMQLLKEAAQNDDA